MTQGKLKPYRLADRLVIRVVPHREIWVIEGLFTRDTLGGVESKHLRKQIDGERVGIRIQGRERNARLDGEGADVVLRLFKIMNQLPDTDRRF